jgi:hypothetical protein
MHGYPLRESMRATMFLAGPNIRRGARIDVPCRLADLTPTLLRLCNHNAEGHHFDGRPLDHAFRSEQPEVVQTGYAAVGSPVYWNDVDLNAWQRLEYNPVPAYKNLPKTVNRPSSFFDLNNVAYNAMSIPDLNVFRLFDDVISPLTGGEEYLTETVETVDRTVRNSSHRWLADAATALNVPQVAPSDYSFTSLGNLQRASGAVDWAQARGKRLDARMARKFGRVAMPGSQTMHAVIDGSQYAFWETYRFGQRIVMEVLDERIINGLENGTDRVINSFDELPAEVIVETPEERLPVRR